MTDIVELRAGIKVWLDGCSWEVVALQGQDVTLRSGERMQRVTVTEIAARGTAISPPDDTASADPAAVVLSSLTPRKGPNRATACPSWLPRPDSTKTCDEYPMASTAQGASTGLNPSNGRTFAGCLITAFPEESGSPGGVHFVGFSSCMIKANQNSAQGGIMVTFYRKNRVLDGDALYVTAG